MAGTRVTDAAGLEIFSATNPGSVQLTGSTAKIDGATSPIVQQMLYNGATYDLQRNNTQGTLLASAARTATTISANQINHNQDGVVLTLNVTANPGGAETLNLGLYLIDPVSGGFLFGSIASINTTAAVNQTYRLIVHPGASSTADTAPNNKAYALAIPRVWLAAITPSGAGSWTYSLAYSLM